MSDVFTFAFLLRTYRGRRKLTQTSLAQQAGVHPSLISRLEKSEREPPRRIVALALIRILGLDTLDANRLLTAGGHAPLIEVPWDDALQDVAGVLAVLTTEEQVTFRAHLRRFCQEWMPDRPGALARMPIPVPAPVLTVGTPGPTREMLAHVADTRVVPTPVPPRNGEARAETPWANVDVIVKQTPVSAPVAPRKTRVVAPVVVREECCRVCHREFGVDRLRSWADENVCEECS